MYKYLSIDNRKITVHNWNNKGYRNKKNSYCNCKKTNVYLFSEKKVLWLENMLQQFWIIDFSLSHA